MRRTSTSVISEIRNLKDSNWIERKLLLFSFYLASWRREKGNPINRKGICKDAVRSFLITVSWHGTAWLYLFIAISLPPTWLLLHPRGNELMKSDTVKVLKIQKSLHCILHFYTLCVCHPTNGYIKIYLYFVFHCRLFTRVENKIAPGIPY